MNNLNRSIRFHTLIFVRIFQKGVHDDVTKTAYESGVAIPRATRLGNRSDVQVGNSFAVEARGQDLNYRYNDSVNYRNNNSVYKNRSQASSVVSFRDDSSQPLPSVRPGGPGSHDVI